MRLLTVLLFLITAPSAIAAWPPGPPPWSCVPFEACNAEDVCASFVYLPIGFYLRAFGNEKNIFVAEGHGGDERIAMLVPTLEDAQRFVETDLSERHVSIILIRNNQIADTNSFWAHSVFERATGKRFVGKDRMLIACDSIRK